MSLRGRVLSVVSCSAADILWLITPFVSTTPTSKTYELDKSIMRTSILHQYCVLLFEKPLEK